MHTSNADLASKEHGFKKSSVVANSACKRDHGTRKSSRTLLTDQKKKKKKKSGKHASYPVSTLSFTKAIDRLIYA